VFLKKNNHVFELVQSILNHIKKIVLKSKLFWRFQVHLCNGFQKYFWNPKSST
jgi:hypothetical protein